MAFYTRSCKQCMPPCTDSTRGTTRFSFHTLCYLPGRNRPGVALRFKTVLPDPTFPLGTSQKHQHWWLNLDCLYFIIWWRYGDTPKLTWNQWTAVQLLLCPVCKIVLISSLDITCIFHFRLDNYMLHFTGLNAVCTCPRQALMLSPTSLTSHEFVSVKLEVT